MRKNFSGTDQSPRNANIAHIQLGAVVCAWWCLFTASIYVMARIALTHRTGRCSNSCAFLQRIHRQRNEIAVFHGYTSQCRHTRRIAHDVSCARRNPQYANYQGSEDLAKTLVCAPHTVVFTRTAEVTICIISERLPDRPRQLPHVNSLNSPPRPQSCTRDIEDGTVGGQMGGSPKAPQQHLAGETSLLGVTRSPTAVARASVTSREMATIGWELR